MNNIAGSLGAGVQSVAHGIGNVAKGFSSSIQKDAKRLIAAAVLAYVFAIFNISMDKFGGEHYLAQKQTIAPFVVGLVAMTASGLFGVWAAKSNLPKWSLMATIFSFLASATMGVITWDQHDKAKKKKQATESGGIKIKDNGFWKIYKTMVVAEVICVVGVAAALCYVSVQGKDANEKPELRRIEQSASTGKVIESRSRSNAVYGDPPKLTSSSRSRSMSMPEPQDLDLD